MKDAAMVVFIVIIAVCVAGGVASTFFLGHDNAIEETAEKILEEQTGADVDLSPSSPESP